MGKIKVFVSYTREDAKWLRAGDYNLIPWLVESLRTGGLDVEFWSDPLLQPGDEFELKIREQIQSAQFAILLLSQQFLNSEFVKRVELHAIRQRVSAGKLRIIPILVGRVPRQLPKDLRWIDQRHIIPSRTEPLVDFVGTAGVWDKHRTRILDDVREIMIADGRREGWWKPWRKLIVLVLLIGLVTGGVAVWRSKAPKVSMEFQRNCQSFFGAMPWLNWLIYDPTEYDPYHNRMASEGSIRADLRVLRSHGFDGLITITSQGTCGSIARIAHEEGFNQVIVGVWDLRNADEIHSAEHAAEWASAYCLGCGNLDRLYSKGELLRALKSMRKKTARPVTTSENLADYEGHAFLQTTCDFMFPSAHTYWHQGQDPDSAFLQTVEFVRRASRLGNRIEGPPVLVGMVSFPSGGAKGLSPETQLAFFRRVIEERPERVDLSRHAVLSYLCAFDPVWKTEDYGWQPAERHVGLFTADRQPKPAVLQIRWFRHS